MNSLPNKPSTIFCDFDGTIIRIDGTDAVLERFASPEWRTWEAAWVAGEISTQECLLRQAELMRVDRAALTEFVSTLPLDKGFLRIEAECKSRGIPLTVLSDGFDVVAKTVLERCGLGRLPVYANALHWPEADRPTLRFPFASADCTSRAGTCKCALTAAAHVPARGTVYIGDGRSDFCVAAKGHQVFAKGALQQWCTTQHIPFEAFELLDEVADHLFNQEVLIR
jgi:2-hydroxy-3-keto-5-methylthiopentenyl-1-phosphate phosphatase